MISLHYGIRNSFVQGNPVFSDVSTTAAVVLFSGAMWDSRCTLRTNTGFLKSTTAAVVENVRRNSIDLDNATPLPEKRKFTSLIWLFWNSPIFPEDGLLAVPATPNPEEVEFYFRVRFWHGR